MRVLLEIGEAENPYEVVRLNSGYVNLPVRCHAAGGQRGTDGALPPMCSRVFFHSSVLEAVTHEPAMPHLAHHTTLFQSVPSYCLGADLCIDTPCSAIPISVRQTATWPASLACRVGSMPLRLTPAVDTAQDSEM